MLLGLFLDVVIAPLQIPSLVDHLDCFKLLVCIVSILQEGNRARIPELRRALHTHHILFARLYPQCVKTKLHFGMHIVDCWLYWGVLLSCFAGERKHRIMKGVMRFAYRQSPKTALAYCYRLWINGIKYEHAFSIVHFVGQVYEMRMATTVHLGALGRASVEQWCAKLHTPFGVLCKGDLVSFHGTRGRGLGFANFGFAKVKLADASSLHICVLQACQCHPTRTTHWRRTEDIGVLAWHQLQGSLAYAELSKSYFAPQHFA